MTLVKPFARLAIVNRGEPAMRLIRAVREYNSEHGTDIRTIALYTTPDRGSMFARQADESFDLGSATFVDPGSGESKSRYLDLETLGRALDETRAEAVWVGWGFVSERPEFVDLCNQRGVVFLGPSAEVMRRLGDKIQSKHLAEEADVPVSPWSQGPLPTLEVAREHAGRLGFPLMLKAAAGGGGRGIRSIPDMATLEDVFESARSEALRSFGDDTVFLERRVGSARHVEVQIIADSKGKTWALGVRDCSVQRRNQKVFEESPSPSLTDEEDRWVQDAAIRLAESVGYCGAGTVEFLFQPEDRSFAFMEVNPRLQVEHPVTELRTSTDLVKLQIHVGMGGELPGDCPVPRGHAIEARLNAEDPDNAFSPSPGRLEIYELPGGPGVRVDTGFSEGDEIAPEFDSMIGKIIAHGDTREEAIARLTRALQETTVVIQGGRSNRGALVNLLRHPDLRKNEYDTAWLDLMVAENRHGTTEHAELAIVMAAIECYEAEHAVRRARFYQTANRGRPEAGEIHGVEVDLEYGGQTYHLEVHRTRIHRYRVQTACRVLEVDREPLGRCRYRVRCGGRSHRVLSVMQGFRCLVDVDGLSHRVAQDYGGVVRAPSPAVVVSLDVEPGEEVAVGQRLVTLEAMKMEIQVVAAHAGRVKEVLVIPNQQVGPQSPLLIVEAIEDAGPVATGERVDFAPLDPEPEPGDADWQACGRNLEDLRGLVLGYDVEAAHLKSLIAQQGFLCAGVEADDPRMLAAEDQVLEIFVDMCALFHKQPGDLEIDEEGRHSAEEYLFTFLRDFGKGEESLPESFLRKLRKTLAYYGVESLERTPELEESLFRLCGSFQQLATRTGPILSLLQRRIDGADLLAASASASQRRLLDRLIAESGPVPAVGELARELRFKVFDEPALLRTLAEAHEEMGAHLEYLAANPEAPDRAERMQALIYCPQPLKAMLSRIYGDADEAMREVMIELLTCRYYRIRDLRDVTVLRRGDLALCSASYTIDDLDIALLATATDLEKVDDAIAALAPLVEKTPAGKKAVVDLYLWRDDPIEDPEAIRDELLAAFEKGGLPRDMWRISVAISTPDTRQKAAGAGCYTFRTADGAFYEEEVYRGIHTMLGKRLELWRLQNFKLNRLPSVEDVYLFHGVARENPKDERLFALAEIRDVTPVRDGPGHPLRLPNLERVFFEAVAAIREFQMTRPSRRRLHWNRILIVVRPPFTLTTEERNEIMARLEPATRDLGLEKVVLSTQVRDGESGELVRKAIHFSNPTGSHTVIQFRDPVKEPLEPLSPYTRNVVFLKGRGLVYPYELIRQLTPPKKGVDSPFPPGEFQELDLDEAGEKLVPVDREPGNNIANIVVGYLTNFTSKYPEGMKRVALLGDPSRSMGSLAEAECRRIMAALDLAEEEGLPLEWYAISAGARIAMDTGTENMDWIAFVLKRLIEFTQAGCEVNIVVAGVNVGAQPYWNAEATMLMHTKGILIMTPESSMVLTGKRALDYSGGVSAEDNLGIGGFTRIMGPNGQGQYFAENLDEACQLLLRYYEHSYRVPGERFPRKATTRDPVKRDVCESPHGQVDGASFDTIGEIFDPARNPGRKKPFDIRKVMKACVDEDHDPLERWYGMRDAEVAVVWDAHIGGFPVCLLGLESRPIRRLGFVPADGPELWTGGTLFPAASKKVARAINAASGNRPLVVLANLSGFDGSPESLRKLQLEYGAEIGRAVVNFDGPIIFTVVSRYHGGAFVVFSAKLNENMEVAALEGTYASVIGGAPAAAVVFARDVKKRTQADERVVALQKQLQEARGPARVQLQMRLEEVARVVHSEKLGEMATEFDGIHNVHRALEVGSIHKIVPPSELRPYLVDAIERGMNRVLDG